MIKYFIKKFYSNVIIFFLLFTILIPSFTYSENIKVEDDDKENENVLLVKFRDDKNVESVSEYFKIPKENVKEVGNLNIFRINDLDNSKKNKIYEVENTTSQIEFIEKPKKYTVTLTPNDYSSSEQWGLDKMNATLAWDIVTGSSSNIIAILDTGVNGTHEDLTGKVTAGRAFLDNGSTVYDISANTDSDDHGHGTSVAGVASAITNNGKGISGTDWNAQIMPIKILDSDGSGWDDDIADGIIYAAQNGAKIINMSLGGDTSSSTLESAINTAYNTHGCIVVAASGNENTTPISYPARYTNVIAVGATNSSDNRCTPSDWGYDIYGDPLGSNYGSDLDVVAPGNNIKTTKDTAAGNEYRTASGTSLSTPYISGIASLIWAKYPSFTNTQVRSYIENEAYKVSAMGGADFHNEYGFGRADMYRSLNPTPSTNPADYTYSIVSQNSSPTLIPGNSYRFDLTIKNTGNTIWEKYKVNLGTNNPQDRVSGFIREDLNNRNSSGWSYDNRIYLQENKVSPGENGTFSFYLTVPDGMSPGVYQEHFRPVADNITWMTDNDIYWNIIVKSAADSYRPYEITYQNGFPTLSQGEAHQFVLKIRNMGNSTWTRGKVNLGPDRAQDRITGFLREGANPSGWIYYNRIYMVEDSVNPGQEATFSFWLTPPSGMNSGTYREYFRPVADGITWMDDKGIYWDITVR